LRGHLSSPLRGTGVPAVSGKRLIIGIDKGVVHCFGEKK
jgi:hypothetical protein